MNSVCYVNGKKYVIPSGNVSIVNGKVYMDGKEFVDSASFSEKTIVITIQGNVKTLEAGSANVTVNGECNDIRTASGNVTVQGDVNGNVTTMSGDIECKNVAGNVKSTSEDISCLEISGETYTVSGDVTYRNDTESRVKRIVKQIMRQHKLNDSQQQPKSKGNVDENYVEML